MRACVVCVCVCMCVSTSAEFVPVCSMRAGRRENRVAQFATCCARKAVEKQPDQIYCSADVRKRVEAAKHALYMSVNMAGGDCIGFLFYLGQKNAFD